MDISKLPKLSQSPPPPPQASEQPENQDGAPRRAEAIDYDTGRRGQEPISLAEIWISLAVGAILLFMFPTMLKYVSSRLFGTAFVPFQMPDGTVVPYPRVYPQFWSDLCITLFALVLILEAITLAFVRNRPLVLIAFATTVVATALNLWFVLATFAKYGAPLVSLLAVAFGVYIAIYQWRLLKLLQQQHLR